MRDNTSRRLTFCPSIYLPSMTRTLLSGLVLPLLAAAQTNNMYNELAITPQMGWGEFP